MQERDGARQTFSPRVWFAALLLAFCAWLLIQLAPAIFQVLALIFGAFLLSLAVKPPAEYLARWRVPRVVTVLVIYLVVLTLLGLLGGWTGSAVNRQIRILRIDVPLLVDDAISTLDRLTENIPWLAQAIPSLDQLGETLTRGAQNIASALVGAATGTGQFFLQMLVVVTLSIFLATGQNLGRRFVEYWVPPRYRDSVNAVFKSVPRRLERWVIAQLGIIVYFIVAYGAGLLILDVPFAGLIAVIGGVLELVPYIGGVIALVLSVLAALTVSPIKVVWVVLLYIIVTQIEANLVQPQLYGQAANVHPIVVLVSLIFGAQVGGIVGALFAVPLVVVLMAIIEEVRRAWLPEQQDAPAEPPPEGEPAA